MKSPFLLIFFFFASYLFDSHAEVITLFKESRLVFYCKGTIIKKEDNFHVIIKEYIGDANKSLEAAKRLEKNLNGPMFGPRKKNANVFFLCELEKSTKENTIRSLSFGSFAKSFDDKFIISGQSSKEGYFINDIELSIFRSTLLRWETIEKGNEL